MFCRFKFYFFFNILFTGARGKGQGEGAGQKRTEKQELPWKVIPTRGRPATATPRCPGPRARALPGGPPSRLPPAHLAREGGGGRGKRTSPLPPPSPLPTLTSPPPRGGRAHGTYALVVPPHVAALLVRGEVSVPAHQLIQQLRGRNHGAAFGRLPPTHHPPPALAAAPHRKKKKKTKKENRARIARALTQARFGRPEKKNASFASGTAETKWPPRGRLPSRPRARLRTSACGATPRSGRRGAARRKSRGGGA